MPLLTAQKSLQCDPAVCTINPLLTFIFKLFDMLFINHVTAQWNEKI